MGNTKTLNIYTDGGARGNPGPAALGVYIEDESGTNLYQAGKTLGIATNNIAEYNAVLAGLSWALDNKSNMPELSRINFFMDSNLAVSQLNGVFKIKNSKLRELFFEAKKKEAQIRIPIYYSHIRRELNKKADRLVNLALDKNI